MRIRITYRDNEPSTTYEHVHKVSLSPNGLAYHFISVNNGIIGIVPIDVIRRLEEPDADTNIEVVKGKIELAS